MNTVFGLVLILTAAAMIWVARARNGEPARFLKSWIAGQVYLMLIMATGVLGAALTVGL